MLYDPKWTKADPFALPTLIDWLEKQPADGRYNYVCNGHCLLAQYFTAHGFEDVQMYTRSFWHRHGVEKIPSIFNDIAIDRGMMGRHTFGAALQRAREAL